jgi:hypothetical protein
VQFRPLIEDSGYFPQPSDYRSSPDILFYDLILLGAGQRFDCSSFSRTDYDIEVLVAVMM